MMRIGLAGLPNAGKSTLFNFLTGANALVADYAFSTVTPNKSSLRFYDRDASALAAAVAAPDISCAEVELWDIAGLIEDASQGEGLGNEFLGNLKDCDIILHVVRAEAGQQLDTLQQDVATIQTEIALFDHKCLLKPFEKARRMARLYPGNPQYAAHDKVITKAYYGTKEGRTVLEVLSPDELDAVQDVGLISAKPRILLCNTDGSKEAEEAAAQLHADHAGNLLELATLWALTPEEREFLGYEAGPLHDFLQKLLELVVRAAGYKRFYTVGHLGVGQWLVPANATAQTCAEAVHADLGEAIKGVKVVGLQDFAQEKSWAALAKRGAVKKYGPAYIPSDKQVLYFETGGAKP